MAGMENEDNSHLMTVYTYMRRRDVREDYITLMDNLIQAVVSYKKFKMNRTTRPFSKWVTVADEAFVIACLHNYVHVWEYERLLVTAGETTLQGDHEVPVARFTGKETGTRNSWSEEGMKAWKCNMIRVFADRQKRGEQFDALFRKRMKKKYEPKSRAAVDGKLGKAEARKRVEPILTDFNIAQYMAEHYAEPLQESDTPDEWSGKDDDNDDDDDGADAIISPPDVDPGNQDEESSGSIKEV
jgi:hypothetical protein